MKFYIRSMSDDFLTDSNKSSNQAFLFLFTAIIRWCHVEVIICINFVHYLFHSNLNSLPWHGLTNFSTISRCFFLIHFPFLHAFRIGTVVLLLLLLKDAYPSGTRSLKRSGDSSGKSKNAAIAGLTRSNSARLTVVSLTATSTPVSPTSPPISCVNSLRGGKNCLFSSQKSTPGIELNLVLEMFHNRVTISAIL